MTTAYNKTAIVRALLAQLRLEVARAIETASLARAGAVHEEARPENHKDTRALEASYLARGQAQRVADLESAEKRVAFMELREFGPDDAIELSALIHLSDGERSRWYFLASAGGGRSIDCEGSVVDVLTPQAPLGRALVGRRCGEEVVLRLGNRVRELVVEEIR